jgi:thiamine transport system substrate-binding protein
MKKWLVVACASAIALTACASSDSGSDGAQQKEVTLIAYDSFTPEEGIFDAFTTDSGYTVKVVNGGDSGAVISKAILASGNPEGDVLWGVDNTSLSRVINAEVFESYAEVNTGDVCVNIDAEWFASRNVEIPTTLEDLASPTYKDLLVVQDPVSSSPGLGFLLATVAHFGENNWTQYWTSLMNNGVLVAPDWTTAYYTNFSGSSGKGDRPLVVSYGSSPPAEVVFSDPPVDTPPTSVLEASCFKQIEYVGVLRGAKNGDGAKALVDYLLGKDFQESMPLSLFVYPVNQDAQLPEVFTKFAIRPDNPLTLSPDVIADNRDNWLEEWREIVLS